MFQVAKISFATGALLLPASDPYDRELVFEQADFYARRYGSVGVQLGQAEIRVARCTAEAGAMCAGCHQLLRAVSFEVGRQRLCTPCAKRAAGSTHGLRSPH